MKKAWIPLILVAVACCSGKNKGQGGFGLATLLDACEPTQTRANVPFDVLLRGGCTGNQEDYICSVTKTVDAVDLSVTGPAACSTCACTPFVFICNVPALEERVWLLRHRENARLDQNVDVANAHSVFVCGWDGGVP